MEQPDVNKTPEGEVFQEMGGNSREKTADFIRKLAQDSSADGRDTSFQLLGLAARLENGELSSEDARNMAVEISQKRPESSQ